MIALWISLCFAQSVPAEVVPLATATQEEVAPPVPESTEAAPVTEAPDPPPVERVPVHDTPADTLADTPAADELHDLLPVFPADVQGPMVQPVTAHGTQVDRTTPVLDALLPRLPMRGFFNGLLLLVLSLSFALVAQLAFSLRTSLAATGLLVRASSSVEVVGRLLSVFFGVGVLAAWAPAPLAVAMPWVALVGALAFGWSARDVLPDAIAWMALASEGRVRSGRWIVGEGFGGEVVVVGLRATVIRDEQGLEHSVPNRRLSGAIAESPGPWPQIEVALSLPVELDSDDVRSVLREAALISPWVACTAVEVLGDPLGEGNWRVRVYLLEGRFTARFEGALRERAMRALLSP